MLARNELIFKWALYGAATALCLFIQIALFQRLIIWDVIPFIYPLLAAIPATFARPVSGTVFALCVGVVCDLLLPGSFPCLYTMTFPLAGLCAALLSKGLLPTGILCSLVSSAVSFLVTDLFRCFLLWANRTPAWHTGFEIMAREFLITAPLIIPVTLLFRTVYRKTHPDD